MPSSAFSILAILIGAILKHLNCFGIWLLRCISCSYTTTVLNLIYNKCIIYINLTILEIARCIICDFLIVSTVYRMRAVSILFFDALCYAKDAIILTTVETMENMYKRRFSLLIIQNYAGKMYMKYCQRIISINSAVTEYHTHYVLLMECT